MSGIGLSGLMKYRYAKKETDKIASVTSPPGKPNIHCNGQAPRTPDINKGKIESIPDTPESQRPSPSCSPVFNSVKKTATSANPNWGPKQVTSNHSVQGLNKASSSNSRFVPSYVQRFNQSIANSSISSPNPKTTSSITDADREMLTNISNLEGIFPQKPKEELVQALEAADNNYERAVDYLIDGVFRSSKPVAKTPQQKRPLDSSYSASNMSSPDATPVKRQYKRARILSSDDESNDLQPMGILDTMGQPQSNSQSSLGQFSLSTENGENSGESQTIQSPEQIENDKIKFLQGAFPTLPRNILQDTLKQHNFNIDEAADALNEICNKDIGQTENVGSIKAIKVARFFAQAKCQGQGTSHQSNSTTERNKSRIKKLKKKRKRRFADDDMNGGDFNDVGSGDEDWDDDGGDDDGSSSEEEQVETTGQKGIVLKFFNESALSDLLSVGGCSKKKAECIMDMRPFRSWEDMTGRFASAKNVSIQVISECKELLRIRCVVQQLMRKCEKISEELESVISELTNKTSIDNTDADYISKQPKLLNDTMKLTPYQIVGLNWLVVMHEQELNGILGDEMGLGKTIQTIAFLAQMKESGEPGPHLVVAPSSTLDNWLRELKLWCPSLKVLLYYGSQEERAYLRDQLLSNRCEDFDVAVTTYNMATGNVGDRNMFKKFQWHYAIFDEGHMLKNMSSIRYKTLMRINADRRLLLTGTPLQNNLIELMSLLAFVMPDLFTNKTEYLKRIFATMTGRPGDESRSAYEAENMGHAQRILKPFFLRRLKTEVLQQLPKKREYVDHVPMAYEQQELYDRLKMEYKEKVKENSSLAGRSGAAMMMSLRKAANHHLLHRTQYDLLKLREMAKAMLREPTHVESVEQYVFEDMEVMSDFELHQLCRQYRSVHKYQLDDDLIVESGKFRYLDEKLPELKSKGSRVLLFSQFVMMLDIIQVYLKIRKYKFLRLDGSTVVAERQGLIDRFNNDPDIFIFILSTRAGGLGINLTAADTVILHDIDFNPYNDKQAEDRCHRLGQTRDVNVHRLISGNSIEEGMWKCGQGKLKLEQDVTGSGKEGDKMDINDVASLLQEALAMDDDSSPS